MIWSMNCWIFSCCLPVARTVMIPASGLAITEAASRKVLRFVMVMPPSSTLTGGLLSIPPLGADFLPPLAVCAPVPVLLASLTC